MSAFIVGRDHIDAMVGAGFKGRHGPLHWYWGTDRYNISHNVLTNESASYVGRMLWEENFRSVDYRYKETNEGDLDYTYRQRLAHLDRSPVAVLKAIDCYVYQSCEHPEWEQSEAYAYCEALRKKMIAMLPGYEDAQWEIRVA